MAALIRADVRSRFAGPGVAPDPAGDGSGWERGQRIVPDDQLVDAAVLVPLIERPGGMTVLLTRRTETLKRHAGQVSFPGGRSQEDDESPEATALRETEEEIGLPRDLVELIGRLNLRKTGTGYRVTPVVGVIAPPFRLRPDPAEVATVFEVPLDVVLDPDNHLIEVQMREGVERAYYVIRHSEHHIWGFTARCLVNLCEVLKR